MSTRNRVPAHTSPGINAQIRNHIEEMLRYYAAHPDQIEERLQELEEEWDIERILETNSSALSLFGLIMGFAANKRWFALPLAVQSFFMQHALQGWCPPLPFLRRLGYRTLDEINQERYGLKFLRGDFDGLKPAEIASHPNESVHALLKAVEASANPH